jgi:hypothetical protein
METITEERMSETKAEARPRKFMARTRKSAQGAGVTELQRERMRLIDFATAKWEAGTLSDEGFERVRTAAEMVPQESPVSETPLPTSAEYVINNREIRQAILAAAPELAVELRGMNSEKAR